jgi:hypothetical protein
LIITSACSVATSGTRKEKTCSCMKSLLARAQSGYTRAVILTTVCSVTAIGTRKERPCSTSRVFSIMLSSCCASTSSFRDSLPSTIQHGRGKCFHNLVLFHLITSDVLFLHPFIRFTQSFCSVVSWPFASFIQCVACRVCLIVFISSTMRFSRYGLGASSPLITTPQCQS